MPRNRPPSTVVFPRLAGGVLLIYLGISMSGSPGVASEIRSLILNGIQAIRISNLSDRQEVELGRSINQQLLNSGEIRLTNNWQLSQSINRLGQGLVAYSDRPDLPFTFQVVEDDSINAFATAGGFVYITTGAISAADNDDQIASVLAHEIIHVTESHVVKQMRQATFAQAGASLLGVDNSPLVALGMELGVRRPRSREAEYEADQKGLELLVRAGYDPYAMPQFLTKLITRSSSPQFLSTHPHTPERIDRLNAMITSQSLARQATPQLSPRQSSGWQVVPTQPR